MALLNDVKLALRIADATTAFDAEINDLISAAQSDMIATGVEPAQAAAATDPLIKRAIVTYCKAYFGWNNADAPELKDSYDLIMIRLALSPAHSMYTVTFSCSEQCEIEFDGKKKWTNAAGTAVFYSRAQNHAPYKINGGTEQYVDVSADTTVSVTV